MTEQTSENSKKETNSCSIDKEKIRVYALENAIKHGGKANQGAVLSGLFAEGLEKSEIKEIMPTIKEIVEEINKLTADKQREQFSKSEIRTSKREIREGLRELPNAEEGKVIMRMAPFPSGPLHIGNARPFILNDEYVKMYKGKLILVMDDTIGSEAKQIQPEAYKLIEEGIKWLGINYDKNIIYKSDRTEKYYAYAEEMIKKGYMYACECSQEKAQELRAKGIACSCRELPPEEHMKRWKEMFSAKMGSMTIRLKTSMQDPDPAFRDRVMFKISDLPHPRTKNKYRVYPSMEFSWAIDDHIFGVTHVLRGIDHQMSTRVQDFIRNIFNWKNPESIYSGQFAVKGAKISKSKGSREVRAGTYIGWNDPRTWSLQSLKDRGIKPEAIRQFILSLGLKKTSITTPIETLYMLNKKLIEKSPRYFFVENPQKITIKGTPNITAELPVHPSENLGIRRYETNQDFLISKQDLDLMENGNYRLMHLLTFKSDRIKRLEPREYSFVSEEPDNNIKTKFLHWLPHNPYNVKVELRMPDGKIIKGLGEPDLEKLKENTEVQFERVGFANLYKKQDGKLEFWFTHN
jgi:glutamyl-tRNA synthetase